MNLLISDTFSPASIDLVDQARGVELLYRPGISHADLLEIIPQIDALAIRGGTRIDADLLTRANRLKAISRAGIGVENLDLEQANRMGVVVMNTPFGSTTTTAEHTIAMILALARNLPAADRSVRQGEWDKNRFLGIEISGKTLGIVGAGKIGRLVVSRAKALGMRVLIHDPHLSALAVKRQGAVQVELDELLQCSDMVSLHVPLNEETANLINAENLQHVKPGIRIINCATGGLVDEHALATAIQSGKVAGAAIDVFSTEPPPEDHPLLQLDQVICTPHLRAATIDAQANVTLQAIQQLLNFLLRGETTNALNVPSVTAEQRRSIQPQATLAEQLGNFQAQYNPRGQQKVKITYTGQLAEQSPAPLTNALLKGLLNPTQGSMVNHVNAPHLARERGLQVIETRETLNRGYASLIRLSLTGAEGETTVCGALFGSEGRIVEIDGHQLETPLHGQLLILHHQDQPGVVGSIGQALGNEGINIARMSLSRGEKTQGALCLMNLDKPPSPELIKQLCAHPAIDDARLIRL